MRLCMCLNALMDPRLNSLWLIFSAVCL